jgi:hypothetical protein
MQGGMVMPMLAYHANDGSLTVRLESTVPELVPLAASNPDDRFDPADPWFEMLDPSRQGLAFSRRYGFVMDVASDPLLGGTTIWLRKLSSSPELAFFRYRAMGSRMWEPIFGTGGTTNTIPWDGTMFHPAITAPPVAGQLTATFEAFLADATGEPVGGSTTAPFTFNWSVVADPRRPQLSISRVIEVGDPTGQPGSVVLGWPTAMTNFVVEAASTSSSPAWQEIPTQTLVSNDTTMVFLEVTNTATIFRLRKVQ